MFVTRTVPFLVVALVSALGCSSTTEKDGDALGETGVDEAGLRGTIQFETFDDDIGDAGENETRKIITSEAGYYNLFGHYAPWDVDFYTHWVAFYSAGTKSTGGYEASVKKLETSSSGQTIYMMTRLESPGNNCTVTQSETKPYTLIKFKKPLPRPRYARYTRDDDTLYCDEEEPPPPPTCASTLCMVGTHCIDTSEGAECVPDPCPGAGRRNTTTGNCECRVVGICTLGESWNSSPSVCGCE